MILQQNYIKIAEYSQKAFEIYCRRSLGIAIVKELQRRKAKQKQSHYQQAIDDQPNGLGQRIVSEKSLQPPGDESFEKDSVYSQIRKTQNNYEKGESPSVCQRMEIRYGDFIYIQYEGVKVKSYLNKFKLCEKSNSTASHDFRCIFQIVCPSSQTVDQKQPLQEHHRFCLKSISNQRYLQVSEKVCSSNQFFKEIRLSKNMGEDCIFEFELEQNDEEDDREGIITGESIFIKHFSKDLYFSVDLEEEEMGFSYASCAFRIRKILIDPKEIMPKYFRIFCPKYKRYLEASSIDFQSIALKKNYTSAIALTESGEKIKMPAFAFTTIDISKAPEEEIKIVREEEHSLLGCWQFSKFTNKNASEVMHIISPVTGMGISVKNRAVPKLTSKIEENTELKVNQLGDNLVSVSLDPNTHELEVCYDRETQKYFANFSKGDLSSMSRKFKIDKVCDKTTKIVCMLGQIFEVLEEHLYFFEKWGNELETKTDTLYYSVKNIKLGSSQMLTRKKEINFIQAKFKSLLEDPSFSEKDICQTSSDMKIFDLLIQIGKVIWQKIGLGVRIDRENTNSPFEVAKENLEEILMIDLSLILRLIKDNTSNSSSVISEVGFFNKMLIEYPEKIGEILQEAIKNLSIFSSKNALSQCNELFMWVELIEPVRETTVTIQKTYIDIIAQVVIDPHDQGIVSYQNKCKELLFIQKSSKRVGIPRFGVDTESSSPIIIFENQNFMQEFLTNNRVVSRLNLVKFSCASYFIEDFFVDPYNPNNEILNGYILYIIGIIKLFRNLCKGRNKKLIKVVSDWGITQQHIISVFESKKISWLLKAHYMSLWMAVFADQEPLLSFSKRESKCHSWNRINKYNLLDCTALIFKQYTDESLTLAKLQDFRNKFLPILSAFFISFKNKLPQALYDRADLFCLSLILNSINVLIKFGYLSIRDMKNYIGTILQMLADHDPEINKNKIQDIEIEVLHHKIRMQMLEILDTYEDIWVELKGIEFLQNFNKHFAHKEYRRAKEDLRQWWINALESYFAEERQEEGKSVIRKKTRLHLSENQYFTGTDRSSIIYTLNFKGSYVEVEELLQDYLINMLVSRALQQKDEAYKRIFALLEKKMKRCQRICSYLRNTIILSTKEQEQIYHDFSGRVPGRLLNWLKINELVIKLKQYQSERSDSDNSKQRKQKYLELTNILVKVIREIRHYRSQDRRLLAKCQFILVKLNVHSILLQMLSLTEKNYEETIKTLYEFFDELMYENPSICSLISPHLEKFTKHLNFEKIVSIIPTLVEYSADKQSAFWNVRQLIPQISSSHSSAYILETLCRVIELNHHCKETQYLITKISCHLLHQSNSLKSLTQDKICFSFVKLVCKISHTCNDLEQKLVTYYPKADLICELTHSRCYEKKKILLKLLMEVHVRKNSLQNFEIEDYALNIGWKQIMGIPNIFMKLIDRKLLSQETEEQISRLYDEMILAESCNIPTGVEETFLDYVLDHRNSDQVSILRFLEKIIIKWEGISKSKRLWELRKTMLRVQEIIRIILTHKNTLYHRKILQRIERVNSLLNNIVDNDELSPIQYILNGEEKKQIITFFKKLCKLLRKEAVSQRIIMESFEINSQMLLKKRQGSNISMFVTPEDFIFFVRKLKPYILHQEEFTEILNSGELFNFVNLAKDPQNKKINVYWFIEKLTNSLDYEKNMDIKSSLAQEEDLDNLLRPESSQSLGKQILEYKDSIEQAERQFYNQVRSLCEMGLTSFQQTIQKKFCSKVKKSSQKLRKEDVLEWSNNEVFNIFQISSNIRNPILYEMSHEIIIRSIALISDASLRPLLEKINPFFCALADRISSSEGSHILAFVSGLVRNSHCFTRLQKPIGFVCLKAFEQVFLKIRNTQTTHSFNLFLSFKKLYFNLVRSPVSCESLRISMKQKLAVWIREKLREQLKVGDIYQMQLLSEVLEMWNYEELNEEIEYELLFKDEKVRKKMVWMVGKSSLSCITKSNNTNLTRERVVSAVLKTLIKFEENSRKYTILTHEEFLQIQYSAGKIYNITLAQEKNSYECDRYCLLRNECSPYFCNFSLITQYQKQILHLILGLFILTRISITKNIVSTQIVHNMDMIGHIIYRQEGQSKSFSFRLPHLCKYRNKQTDSLIHEELLHFHKAHLPQILHPLSRFALSDFTLLETFSKIKPVQALMYHRSMAKRLLIICQILLIWYQYFKSTKEYSPISISLSIGFAVVNVGLLIIEIYQARNKFQTILPAKFQIFHPQDKKNKISAEKVKFVALEILRSFLILRVALVILSILTITKASFVILLFSIQILDLKIVRDAIKDGWNVISRLVSVLLFFAVFSDLTLLYFNWKQIPGFSTLNIIWNSFVEMLFKILTFWEAQETNQAQLQKIIPFYKFILLNVVLGILFLTIERVTDSKRQTEEQKNTCKICFKTKKMLMEDGQQMKFHVQHVHRFWDYLFFFMEVDRRGNMKGLPLNLKNKIAEGDYSFLKQ